MLKVIGGLLVLGGCCLCGFCAADELSKRVRLLEDWIQAIRVLERELALFRSPLPQLLLQMAKGREKRLVAFFDTCCARMETGADFLDVWVEELETLPLDRQEKRLLCGLGQVLGRYDDRGQIQAAGHIRGELEACAVRARQENRGRGRVYRTLGATAGGFLLLTLI
ncbi:MAG: stage III sporulation protein AB [Oscillospiraceae bacterium]|nr:stage III sporulation protein AB [Oscillospiraceae bacterium]